MIPDFLCCAAGVHSFEKMVDGGTDLEGRSPDAKQTAFKATRRKIESGNKQKREQLLQGKDRKYGKVFNDPNPM